jgi:hypothetical protein
MTELIVLTPIGVVRGGRSQIFERIWSVLKGGVLANLAAVSFARLLQVIRHGLKKIQYQPGLIEGCLAETGLTLEPP